MYNPMFHFLGLICQCTQGFDADEDVNPCEQVDNASYNAQVCAGDTSVCLVFRDQSSNRIIQRCFHSVFYKLGCAVHNYNTMDNGRSLCCVTDYCNSVEAFLEFRANQSSAWY